MTSVFRGLKSIFFKVKTGCYLNGVKVGSWFKDAWGLIVKGKKARIGYVDGHVVREVESERVEKHGPILVINGRKEVPVYKVKYVEVDGKLVFGSKRLAFNMELGNVYTVIYAKSVRKLETLTGEPTLCKDGYLYFRDVRIPLKDILLVYDSKGNLIYKKKGINRGQAKLLERYVKRLQPQTSLNNK